MATTKEKMKDIPTRIGRTDPNPSTEKQKTIEGTEEDQRIEKVKKE